jgi:hypothetical protein
MNNIITLRVLDFIILASIGFLMNLASFSWVRYLDRVRKRKMMEDFLSHIQEKIETEEEFQEIIDKMRRDFGGEQFPKP